MIEILQFGLSRNQGGIETYLKKITENIDKTKYHFSFIDMTGNQSPAFYNELKAEGCDFYKITPRSISVRKNKKDLQKLFSEHEFDILHFNVNTLSYIQPIKAALANDCKVIIHSRSAGMSYSARTTLLHKWNKKIVEHLPVKRIGVSQLACDWLFGKDSDSTVYPNGVDTNRFAFSKEKREIIRKSFGCENKLVVGHVGAFLPVKNHKFTVEVFETLKKQREDAVLWLVGEGELMQDIRNVVHEKGLDDSVLFLGKRNDLPDLYSGMDVHLLPSYFEGMPNVILEAQTSGLPCIISDTVTREVNVRNNVKYLPIDKDPEVWTKMIADLINDPDNSRIDAYHDMNDNGWSVTQEIERIEELYEKCHNCD